MMYAQQLLSGGAPAAAALLCLAATKFGGEGRYRGGHRGTPAKLRKRPGTLRLRMAVVNGRIEYAERRKFR